MTVDEFKNQLAALNSEMTVEDMQRQIVANEARIAELTRLKDELAEDASKERQRAEAAEAKLATVQEYAAYHIEDSEIGPFTESFEDWYNRKKLPARV